MAHKFKPGDRARITRVHRSVTEYSGIKEGAECVVTSDLYYTCGRMVHDVYVEGAKPPPKHRSWSSMPEHMESIIDWGEKLGLEEQNLIRDEKKAGQPA